MTENDMDEAELEKIRKFVKDGRIDDAVKIIALYLGDSTDDNYINRLENVIDSLLSLHGGKIVIRFLIEHLIIDIPSLLENLSKKDSVLRYSFILLLKSICENESDIFLPFSEDLLESEDPNVREASLQLLIFMAGGEKGIEQDNLIKVIVSKLTDEKDFVKLKAIQALKTIGKRFPSVVTRVLTNFIKELPETSEVKSEIDEILRSIVSAESIVEIVEDEEIIKAISSEDKKEVDLGKTEEVIDEICDKLADDEEDTLCQELDIIEGEMELVKKELELKKKKLELDTKEKELEERELKDKEDALKKKEELIDKEKELAQAELELKEKAIKEKEKSIAKEEMKRIVEKMKDIDDIEEK